MSPKGAQASWVSEWVNWHWRKTLLLLKRCNSKHLEQSRELGTSQEKDLVWAETGRSPRQKDTDLRKEIKGQKAPRGRLYEQNGSVMDGNFKTQYWSIVQRKEKVVQKNRLKYIERSIKKKGEVFVMKTSEGLPWGSMHYNSYTVIERFRRWRTKSQAHSALTTDFRAENGFAEQALFV